MSCAFHSFFVLECFLVQFRLPRFALPARKGKSTVASSARLKGQTFVDNGALSLDSKLLICSQESLLTHLVALVVSEPISRVFDTLKRFLCSCLISPRHCGF